MIRVKVGEAARSREADLLVANFLLLLPEVERGEIKKVVADSVEGIAASGSNLLFFQPPSRYYFLPEEGRKLLREVREGRGSVVLLSDRSESESVFIEGEKGRIELRALQPAAINYPRPIVVISSSIAENLGIEGERRANGEKGGEYLTAELHNLITEVDVWRAIRMKKKLVVKRWQKITPAAEELGKQRKIFVYE